ncbi:MAG: aminoacetone oxidase family FAD-binding enzyme [Clostridia bacterium]|nr:aminoacetone oxidase family FAD-binding enzyme [Clostridia bacterium]
MMREAAAQIAIIGAGASGLIAAVTASGKHSHSVLLLEKNARVGRKLLATGNGRCNLLNTRIDDKKYHGSGKNTALALLMRIPPAAVMRTFENMGLALREESDGRVYPFSGLANSVLDTLRLACDAHGVQTRCGAEVKKIQCVDGMFRVYINMDETILVHRVIVAAGGKAAPVFGSDGSAYALLESLGHTVRAAFPALSPLKIPVEHIRGLKGIRLHASLTLSADGETLRQAEGELLFTEYGVSGIAAMQLSRFVKKGSVLTIHLMSEAAAAVQIKLRLSLFDGQSMENFFTGLFHKRVSLSLLREAGIPPSEPVSETGARRLLPLLINWRLPVLSALSFQHAQVTAGGAMTDEFNGQTLESLRIPGLYACGEAMDVDGDCGGYNLLWAWISGITAGEAAARSLPEGAA